MTIGRAWAQQRALPVAVLLSVPEWSLTLTRRRVIDLGRLSASTCCRP
ncbi:hypothetical protein [Pseudonocardia sp. GCM10023141]